MHLIVVQQVIISQWQDKKRGGGGEVKNNPGALGLLRVLGGQRQVSDYLGMTGTSQMDLQA
jgi:hypothetical protein